MIRIRGRLIVGLVASVTLLSRILEHLSFVAGNTGDRLVSAAQGESREIVIKSSAPLSGIDTVAFAAIC
jgi:hypothetical protein